MIRLLLEHEGRRTELSIDGSDAVIGRSSGNSVPVPDRRLSRSHARIERDDLGFVIRDLGSANGTWLNRRRVSSERLVAGDEIRVGRCVIHVLALARIS